jgi:hypothetical protein
MKKLISFIIAITICFAILFYAGKKMVKWISTPQIMENVPSTKELSVSFKNFIPATATNISYCIVPLLTTTYEYRISEKDFLTWAKTNNVPITPIKEPSLIYRYHSYLISNPTTDDPNKWEEYELLRRVRIKKGYEYHYSFDDGGGSHIVYDSDAQKAYHDYPSR